MSVGVVKGSCQGGVDKQSDNVVDNALSTLARCLSIASTSNESSIPGAVEESSWPHDHHTLSDDAPPIPAGDRRNNIRIVQYQDESQIGDVMRLITKDLSEPYSIYTYRYFIHNWPQFCLLAQDITTDQYVGVIVCKMEKTLALKKIRGYIAMLAVDEAYRKMGVGTKLVHRTIELMVEEQCDEVALETEVSNVNAQRLYLNLGFVKEKRLFRYYLNGVDAFRLKLYFTAPGSGPAAQQWAAQEVA
ncbi:hypothetical protein PFISCL1PPCAC_539 [Pristionchus fissidentatus]|uniref:N-alpha-acetyltransferase 30 n=1 Tax=Pristionchus fissidentatus TaxID=1538716 RepID=A0AAV5URP8_9BILA|nr:hypothetical protein PFISCL1PPCAC_539 [Pristionchus fissidentatus]